MAQEQSPPKEHSSSEHLTAETRSAGPHIERHTSHGELVRDSIIGFADGLTVPFALTAGLSAVGSSKLVILGGLAELFAGKADPDPPHESPQAQ